MHVCEARLRADLFPDVDVYPFNLDVFTKTESLEFTRPVTFFTGENGTGKSTLLKAICQRCGIHIWEGAHRVRLENNPWEKTLWKAVQVTWEKGRVSGAFFGSQIFQNFAFLVEEWETTSPGVLEYYGGKSLVTQSHGQSLMSFFSAVTKRPGLYFLDEPETALSPKTQLVLLDLLAQANKKGESQFIIASHSPILMSCPDSVIYSFDQAPINPIAYKDTDHFKVYAQFMEGMK
ncbi:Predicted ATPase [Desulfatibacillum alkenivorans DSM 16219]|jgi:predicted ATPase|uniref:Predicted ATPase n=1 Tax=Desulfatibacillum alkenivorans DSM 16219 TaxID=1121393 RepID=A0A1M6SCM1_9BACT|nr:AAA family ATPase [Desulfatibacillum alkenivorans]SHK42455.1 Predicted ATPase [Desulfatibacillum alkenivorans DSM 16219]